MENKDKMKDFDLRLLIEETFNKPAPVKEKNFIMYSGCISKPGQLVKRDPSSMDFNLCNNPKCPSCSQLHRAIKEEATRMTFKPYDNKR